MQGSVQCYMQGNVRGLMFTIYANSAYERDRMCPLVCPLVCPLPVLCW